MSQEEIQNLTTEELRKHILTQDYKGPKVKEKVLDELILRAIIEHSKAILTHNAEAKS